MKIEELIYAPDRDYHESDSFEAQIWWNKIMKRLAPLVPYVKVTLLADRKERLGHCQLLGAGYSEPYAI